MPNGTAKRKAKRVTEARRKHGNGKAARRGARTLPGPAEASVTRAPRKRAGGRARGRRPYPRYRFLSADGKRKSTWRRLTKDGMGPPGRQVRARLGEGYSCQFVIPRGAAWP